jgi:HEAT repeat protein
MRAFILTCLHGVFLCGFSPDLAAQRSRDPYALQVEEQLKKLGSDSREVRAGAIEALGFLRAYRAEQALVEMLRDPSTDVRRQAALALAWCGSGEAISPLIETLNDTDPVTRQAAQVSLSNLSGMEFLFDTTAGPAKRTAQMKAWRDWWQTVSPDRPPPQVLELLREWHQQSHGTVVHTSSTYRGPPSVLTDDRIGPGFWQTKNVPFPQSCTIDLGQAEEIAQVVIHQHGPGFVMTDYELATSLDNKSFEVVERKKRTTPVTLQINFSPRQIRYLRVTSYDSVNPVYPTTFFEIEARQRQAKGAADIAWRCERGLRALGSLGGEGATNAILRCLAPSPPTDEDHLPMVRAGLRSLGRLRNEAGFAFLIALLEDTYWARYAADALGDYGDARAVPSLLTAYRKYAKQRNGKNPTALPPDDRMGFPSEDRMLETPYCIAFALCRLVSDAESGLAEIAPLIMANLPGDHDTFLLYQPEVGHLLTRYLMELSGLRQVACEHAFELLGQPRRFPATDSALPWPQFAPDRMASWLPAICTEEADLPRLLALLKHEDGWVRLNAAKTLAWIGDKRAVEPIARLLSQAKAEADYGYSGTFKDEEYADPAPRWREGLIRALGKLHARKHAALIVRILEDEASVVEVRHAAAKALAELGGETARLALQRAASNHPFQSVRQVAHDALRFGGHPVGSSQARPTARPTASSPSPGSTLDAVLFIQGDNNIPNTIGTVEQADRWRQTYVVTDSGPAYRPGRNLSILRPPQPDGVVTALTHFEDGYVAEPELSWDARHVIFTRRGQDDPWWHIYRINLDGSGLEQLTRGPYHNVGPAYLPDGRIVFASSRIGIRDEYHGYPCTSLHVMDADGSGIHTIATNIGRDNEPAILNDGRIVFSRLDVFYSRNKTELTLHATNPDGTRDVVLYGPERRAFWRNLDHGPRTPADGQEAPLTHRVLRMTQPQPMPDGQNIVVVTQGGLTLIGPSREREEIITPNNKTRAYTTPFPLPDGSILCASSQKTPDRTKVDLGLYRFDPERKELTLIYNDPTVADFEPRPIRARTRPPILPTQSDHQGYSGRFFCASAFTSQEAHVATRGRLIRLIEGVPVVARHSTQTNRHEVWKNHGGTFARVLGTAPLAKDGSFFVEVPADRLLHFQVLDSDRRVLGNQLTWIYARPNETKTCVGCHEKPDTAPRHHPRTAQHLRPLSFLPSGDEFTYRAKAWFKGTLPPHIEERTRTVRAVNLLAR